MCEYVCICACVCFCKLDIGTWKMKVNSMATQGYFCPSIHLSVLLTLSQFWFPLSPLLLPNFPPPLFFLHVISPSLLLLSTSDISVAMSAQSNQSTLLISHLLHQSHLYLSPYPDGMTVILHLRGYYSSALHWLPHWLFTTV